jgi:ribonuclease D
VQLAADGAVAILDPLASVRLGDLGPLLSAEGPVKIVHDVAFDARMLAEASIALGNVHDTAVVAQMLGRPATGLASLAASELGIVLDKRMQGHDWSRRPLDAGMLAYLSLDVLHLSALEDKLWGEAERIGIEAEVLEETRYRIASAARAVREPDQRPAYARIKGIDKLPAPDQAIVRRLAEAREREAERLDTPANELVGSAALVDLARAKPTSMGELRRVRGATPRREPDAVARQLVRAIALGIGDHSPPEEDRVWLERARIPAEIASLRRHRETRLLAWRKAEAARRGVNEQVVLPGHCVKDLVELAAVDAERVASVPGIGTFRAARDGEAIARALLTEEPPPG